MHKIIPYILAACCLCMVASCDTVFDVHPYDVQIDGDRNLNVTNIQKIEAAVKSKDTIRFAMISDSHQWLDDLKSEVNDINRRSDSLDFVIHCGDLTDFGATREFQWTRDHLQKLKIPFVALLGVVAAPITSGDTALRSARLIIAEFIGLEQRSMRKRLYICVPLFALTVGILVWQMENPDGFNIIWQYFGWANQTLSVFTLWTLTVYLVQQKKPFVMTLVPALFMTVICSTFLLISPTALALGESLAYTGSVIILVIALVWFLGWYRSYQKKQ